MTLHTANKPAKVAVLSAYLFASALFTTGCVSIKSNREPLVSGVNEAQTGPETKDVPYQARAAKDGSLRKRIIVLPFLNSVATRSQKASAAAREVMIHSLLRTDNFVVVSNSDFPRDVASYVKNGEYDLEEMAKVGANLGVAAILEGKVLDVKATRLGDEIGLVREIRARMEATVQLRMVSTKNGKIILNDMRSASVEDANVKVASRSNSDRSLEDDPQLIDAVITKAFQTSVSKISVSIDKLSWEGRVAMMKGERVFLNAGRLSGLQVGDILKVMEEGEDVFDPESGSLIGRVPGRVKGTVEVVSYFGKDGAIAVIHSGGGFKENDLVELY